MSATAAGSISSAFLFGFAISLVVLSALADRVGARRIFLWAIAATAVTTAFIPLFARSYLSGLLLFTLLALVNGGTYTPGIMLVADRFPPERRGNAIGWFLAAASLGYAVSLALTGLLGWWLRRSPGSTRIIGASVAGSLLFFLVTNFGVWAVGELYPLTTAGLWQCYVAAVPFFRGTLLGDLVYAAVLFGGYALATSPARARDAVRSG
jgi:MFS family permease